MTTLATFTDFEPGELTSEKLYRNFYGQHDDSLAIINGQLGLNQISSVTTLTYKHIQTGAFSGGLQVGGTATLDYFSGGNFEWVGESGAASVGPLPTGFGWFRGIGKDPTADVSRWLPIPGANLRMHLPYDAYVLIMWTITWANDSQDAEYQSQVCLFIDGLPANQDIEDDASARRVRRSQFGNDPTGAEYTRDHIVDRYKGRTYSGHFFTTSALSAGFHDIGLHLGCSAGTGVKIKQTKIRARSLKYIYFRRGATF